MECSSWGRTTHPRSRRGHPEGAEAPPFPSVPQFPCRDNGSAGLYLRSCVCSCCVLGNSNGSNGRSERVSPLRGLDRSPCHCVHPAPTLPAPPQLVTCRFPGRPGKTAQIHRLGRVVLKLQRPHSHPFVKPLQEPHPVRATMATPPFLQMRKLRHQKEKAPHLWEN